MERFIVACLNEEGRAADCLPDYFASREEAERAARAAYRDYPWMVGHEVREVESGEN